MDTGERLAAYLSGDLDPDERTALEAELAGDPALRARLDRQRRTDAALASMREVELPDGFGDRLGDRLRPELDAVLGDELAARRARRGTAGAPRWVLAAAGAAAAVAVVAGAVSVIGVGGSDDSAEDAGGDAGVALDGEREATGLSELGTMAAPAAGPVIADRGRQLDRDDLTALAQDPEVQAALTRGPVTDDPQGVALSYAATLGAPLDAPAFDDEGSDGGQAASETAAAEEDAMAPTGADLGLELTIIGDVSDEERATVGACLPELYEAAADPVVPVYAELAEAEDGTPVVVYAALGRDADGTWSRLELWMLERDTCSLVLFVQADAQPAEVTEP